MSPSILGAFRRGLLQKIEFKQGQQELNGEEALAYVRMRKQDQMATMAGLLDKDNY